MIVFGQTCLLAAFVGSGYAAFACLVGGRRGTAALRRSGLAAALGGAVSLTIVLLVLAWALLTKDFRFNYVAEYSSRLLPWHYSLSALWVGQAGSLLLWAWVTVVLALSFRFWPSQGQDSLRDSAFGVLMGYVCFLLAIMAFAADPMAPNRAVLRDGAGLSPLLQHPSMLIHPPVVFAGYAAWAVPFALATAAMLSGRLDAAWTRLARPWALMAWTVLGAGILLGAHWAYQELGWGGYWGWDPVENGSLMPWLTGTALIHCLMTWQRRGGLKKTTLVLAVATFGLCNFVTFLTRSGIFSSVHAFSESPIGWMFLALMSALAVVGASLVVLRREALTPTQPTRSIAARETLVLVSTALLSLLTLVVLAGTLVGPLSTVLVGRTVLLGPAFYNNALIPIGLSLLTLTAVAPLLRWGAPPRPAEQKALLACAGVAVLGTVVAFSLGVRRPISLTVACAATLAASALAGTLFLDARRCAAGRPLLGALPAISRNRRQYAGYLIHAGFVCIAIGVTGSSLGTRRHDAVMNEGDVLEWAGRRIRYVQLIQRELPDKLVAEVDWKFLDRVVQPLPSGPRATFIYCKTNGQQKQPSAPTGVEISTPSSTAEKKEARSR